MRSIKSLFFPLALIILLGNFVFAAKPKQKPIEEYNFFKAKYPNESAVYVVRKQNVKFEHLNDSVIVKIDVYEELMHLGENTVRHASDKVFSSSFTEISNLEAYTLVPDKKKYNRADVTGFKESYDTNSSVFYDDSKQISFTYPSIQQGAKTIIKYTKTIKDPRMMHMFFIDTYVPVDKANYTIEHGKNVTVNPQIFNRSDLKIEQQNEKLPDGNNKLVYHASDIGKITFASNGPSYRNLATTIYSPIISYNKTDGKEVELNSSIDQLHAWYRTFVSDILDHDEGLNKLANSIVSVDDDELEKVKKVYYWVQSNIKYIAFEDGMRGFVPHPGTYVVDKKYGDCKDMASVIVALLRELDIEAQYTWVGTRDLPYKYSKVPDPITDNHMIATYQHNGITYFLDATGQYTPINLPTSMIQGKECLVSFNDEKYKVVDVPVIPKETSVMTDSVNIQLKEGELVGSGQVTLTGYAKVFNTYKLIKSNQKSIDDYVKRLISKGSNKFYMSSYELSNVKDYNIPTNIDYSFSIPDYYRQIGEQIYINLVLDKTMTDALLDNRKVALENDYKYINRNVVRLEIPEGFYLNTTPKDVTNKNDFFGYSITYDVRDTEVLVSKVFFLDYLTMPPNSFDAWNDIISEYAKACRKAIILSKQ